MEQSPSNKNPQVIKNLGNICFSEQIFKENSSWVPSLPLGPLFQAPHHNLPENDREKEDEKQ